MKFTKMQGIGNDYVYINCFEEEVGDPSALSRLVSDRHFGIGSDGLILICPSKKADCQMRMFNADGSESEMCGNAVRCVGKYIYEHGLAVKTDITVETGSGIRQLKLHLTGSEVTTVTADMGEPLLTSLLPESICVDGTSFDFVGISMGNPHAVYFVEKTEDLNLEKIGPYFENHERFPERTNTEFVQVIDQSHIKMRVWERGSGETMACGTGACASAAASILMNHTGRVVDVELLGGNLLLEWDENNNHIYMTGPAVEVFQGEFEIENLIKYRLTIRK